MAVVSLRRVPDYEQHRVKEAVNSLFDQYFAPDSPVFAGKTVAVKPNLLMKRRPQEATTTHPAVVSAVVEKLWALGAKEVVLADSPGGPFTHSWVAAIYKATGMAEVAVKTGARLNENMGHHLVLAPDAAVCREFDLIDALAEADVIVNVGKLKTHAMTALSGGVKNLFGAVAGLQKPGLHYRFPELEDFCGMLLDLSQLLRPAFTVFDAVESMEGNGPSGGKVRGTGVLFASDQLYELDYVLSRFVGLEPAQVKTVELSIRRGLCPSQLERIQLWDPDGAFVPVPDFQKPASVGHDFSSYVPALFQRPFRFFRDRYLTPHPVIRRERCIGCGRCAESCPPQVIAISGGKAVIRRKRCIRCFCCHEMCPVKAVEITSLWLPGGRGKG